MTMILEAIRAGTTYALSDIAQSIIHVSQDGFGMPAVARLMQRSPLQHGVSDVGFHIDARKVELVLQPFATTEAAYYDARERLLKIFTPDNAPVKLRATYPTGRVRQLDVFFDGGLSFGRGERSGFSHRGVVGLYAPDPIWYDPTQLAQVFALGGGTGVFAVPLAVPVAVGASTIDITTVLTYAGSWRSEPTVRIVGPITNPIITNLSTDEKLDFTGTTIAAGDYYEIDTRFGYKTVKDAAGANKIAKLTSDSDLATFHLAPDPEVVNGENSIKVTGSAATAATSLTVYWYSRYIGL